MDSLVQRLFVPTKVLQSVVLFANGVLSLVNLYGWISTGGPGAEGGGAADVARIAAATQAVMGFTCFVMVPVIWRIPRGKMLIALLVWLGLVTVFVGALGFGLFR